jgi:hypothetical protein
MPQSVALGIGCSEVLGEQGVQDTPLGKSPMWDAPMDWAESHPWAMAINSDHEFFAGQSIMDVVEL